jgi:hypothetical protein
LAIIPLLKIGKTYSCHKMTRNEENIIKEQSFFPPAAPNLFQERKTTRTQLSPFKNVEKKINSIM